MITEEGNRDDRVEYSVRFRDDIDPATTWVVSDTHFGHDNIVGYCHRPEDHEQVLIAEWRKVVPDEATVVHLGDLCYSNNAFFKHIVAKELTGARKLLIQGNHDRGRFSFYRDCGFRLTRPFALRVDEDEDGIVLTDSETPLCVVSFSHYPWDSAEAGRPIDADRELRLHGHIHNNGYSRSAFAPFLRGHLNLSAEQTKYRPVNLKALLDGVLLGRVED